MHCHRRWDEPGLGDSASHPQVRERDLPFVTHTLSSEFTILRVVNGETVAAENLSVTNGFVKPKMGELGLRGIPPEESSALRLQLVLTRIQVEQPSTARDDSHLSPAHDQGGCLWSTGSSARWWLLGRTFSAAKQLIQRPRVLKGSLTISAVCAEGEKATQA